VRGANRDGCLCVVSQAVLGGKENPSAADVKAILGSGARPFFRRPQTPADVRPSDRRDGHASAVCCPKATRSRRLGTQRIRAEAGDPRGKPLHSRVCFWRKSSVH